MDSIFDKFYNFPTGVIVGIIIGLLMALTETYIVRLLIRNESQGYDDEDD